jgi:tripartite-type tricarboxylate transporter receptor subunit TctC
MPQQLIISALVSVIVLGVAPSFAQQQPAKDYPSKPIRVVVPYAPGGPMDFIARTLGNKMAPTLGQNLVIDNRVGAGGTIGTANVAKSPADGYTILHTSSSHASLPVVLKNVPYDALKDFTPITLVANSVGFILVSHPSVPARNVKELIALARAQAGKLTYASAGVGNVMHLAAESFNVTAGTRMTHVPYKGVGQAIGDLLGGRIDIAFVPGTAGLPHIQSGRLRALGLAARARWKAIGEVPTIDEAGVKGYKYAPFYALWFPAGAPQEYVSRIRNEVAKALADAEVARGFADQGFVPVGSTPAELHKAMVEELEFNRKLVATIGLQPE